MDINQLAVYSKKASASIHGAMRAPVRQSPACQLLVALTVFAAAALLMTAAVARGAEDPRCMGMGSTLLGGLTLDCGKVDALSSSEPLFSQTDPAPMCKLMVVAAGAPRTGSTLSELMALQALKDLNVSYVNLGYWRYDRHNRNKKDFHGVRWSAEYVRSRIPSPSSVVIVKSHEYDTELVGMCDEVLVIAQGRNAHDLAASAMGAGWLNKCDAMYSFLRAMEAHHICWRRHSQLAFHYRELKGNKISSYTAILGKLAPMVAWNGTRQDWLMLANRAPLFNTEANPTIPGRKSSAVAGESPLIERGCAVRREEIDECFPGLGGNVHVHQGTSYVPSSLGEGRGRAGWPP